MNQFTYSDVRQEIIDAIKKDLIGPRDGDEEVLDELPELSYLTGLIHPLSKDSEIEFDQQEDIALEYDDMDSFGDEDNDDKYVNKYKVQNSFGISFYLTNEIQTIEIKINWGDYIREKSIGEKNGKEISKRKYRRHHRSLTLKILADNSFKSKTFDLGIENKNSIDTAFYRGVLVKISQYKLSEEYRLVSVYVTNNRSADEELSNGIMFQAETIVKTTGKFYFIPEYMCREVDLTDEFLYECKPVYSRGYGCGTNWQEFDGKTIFVETTFIPEHELPGVNPELTGFIPKTFSMKFFSKPKNRKEIIERLANLHDSYLGWVENLKKDPKMKRPDFNEKGKQVIEKCELQASRINDGIRLLETDDTIFEAFCFMNQAMFKQRAINAFSLKNGRGIICNLREELDKDNSEWRAFQIAFILLNLTGITNYKSDFRNYVDLLYFPTGGGKTEAYLGLMAFLMGYRRMTNDESEPYNKDGGVTIILRYTLRLLTTQQRDRLTKMIVAAEIIRRRKVLKGDYSLGTETFSIGFYVGGSVTPNGFKDFKNTDSEPEKFSQSISRLNNQLITCPFCGKKLEKDNFIVDLNEESIHIYCGDKNCYFFRYDDDTVDIPV